MVDQTQQPESEAEMAESKEIDAFMRHYADIAFELDHPEEQYPLENAAPVPDGARITDDLIRKYFSGNTYPYSDRMSPKQYYREKIPLQIELVKLQNWVKDARRKLVIVFEGRDAAGKGGTIRTFTENLNPRGAQVVALSKPTENERDQWYFQRYVQHLPTAGEIVFFDRSWYNRAGVERVMGFCSEQEYWEFTRAAPDFEEMLVRSGIILIKFYLSVSKSEQARRFEERRSSPLKRWKLSPIDMEAQSRWDDYTDAKIATFRLTDRALAPWTIVKSEDKPRARLNAMRHVLNVIDYEGKDPKVAVAPDPLIVAPARLLYGVASSVS